MIYENKDKNDLEPLVSIIIPVFNREDFLKENLHSIQKQTYSNWEAICVDDGSTDKSIEIIHDFSASDNRIKFFNRNRNPKGAQTCRNIGLERAQGKYVIFLDSDDLLAPYCLKKRVEFMENNPCLDFSVFHVLTFEKEPGDTNILWNIFTKEDDLFRFISDDAPWQTSSPIWEKDFVKMLKWDESCISGQDWDFHVNALSLSPKYKKIDDIPDCFIRRDTSAERISKNFYKVPQILNRKLIWEKNYKNLKQKNLWKKEYNIPFASFYFRFCKLFLLKLKYYDFDVWRFYNTVFKERLLNIFIFLWTSFYIMGLFWLRNNRYILKFFHNKLYPLMPDYLKIESYYKTQEQVKLEGDKLSEFLRLNKESLAK